MTDQHADPTAESPPNGDADVAIDTNARAPALGSDAADTDVPPDAPRYDCDRCGRPFPHEKYLVLHRGLDHYDDLSDVEREAFAAAYDAERDDIRRFRILALGGMVALYFGFLLVYAVFA